MKPYLYILSVIILCVGCKSNELEFGADNSVYFNEKTDTTKVSFTYMDETQYRINIYTAIIGEIVNYDREVKAKITYNNCVEGVDYIAIPDTYTIKAGNSGCPISLTIIKNKSLQTEEKFINIELIESEDFATHFIVENNMETNSKTISKIKHTIGFSEFMSEKPKTWNEYNFGVFSYKKFTLMCDVMSIPRAKFIDPKYMTPGRLPYVAKSMKNYLVAEKAAGRTVYDEDGVTEMTMGAKI